MLISLILKDAATFKSSHEDVKIGKDVNIEDIARLTTGLAGADLENIINEAALLAGRKSKTFVEQADLVEAVEIDRWT